MEPMVWWRIPCFAFGETRSGIMAGWRRAVELAMTVEEIERLTALSRVAHRAGGPGIAGADAAGLSRESFVLCGGAKRRGPPSNGSALRGAGAGLWAAGGHRGSTTAGQRTGHHAGGQGLVGIDGVRQGQGARLSA